jgi:methyl-accepting chemotaxis protein
MLIVEKNSKEINKILRKIENVIIQTTMLAVSGSIEAARAGEFGKGFAVVSADVRNLAQDSQANLEKIFDIVAGLEDEIDSVKLEWVGIMKNQEIDVKDLLLMSSQIEKVVSEMKEVESLINNLAQANAENQEALEQALKGAEQIQSAAELARNNTAESKKAADLIETTVGEMGNLVEELAVLADELQQG